MNVFVHILDFKQTSMNTLTMDSMDHGLASHQTLNYQWETVLKEEEDRSYILS